MARLGKDKRNETNKLIGKRKEAKLRDKQEILVDDCEVELAARADY